MRVGWNIAVVLVCSLMLSACFVFDFESDTQYGLTKSQNPTPQALKVMVNRTDFDISNVKLMSRTEEYRGKYIGISGTISSIELPGFKRSEQFVISSSGSERYVSCVVKLDHPPTEQKTMSDPASVVVPYKHIRVIAEFIGVEEFLTESGDRKKIPVANCIAIFSPDDRNYEHPVWFWKKGQ